MPVAVAWLTGIMVAVHLVRLLLPLHVDYLLVEYLAFDSSVYTDAGVFGAKPLAAFLGPLTHVFLHANAVHLALNAGLFLSFGSVVARRMAPWWFVAFFGVCGLAGAAGWFLLNPLSPALLIGASGAISGMIGAVSRLGMQRLPSAAGRPPFRNRHQAVMLAVTWILLNMLFAVSEGLNIWVGSDIAWEAHLGGFAAGFLLTYIFDGRGLSRSDASADLAPATTRTDNGDA